MDYGQPDSKRPTAIERLAGVVDSDARERVQAWDRNTCGFHATMIEKLSGGVDKMGPRVRDIYDRLMVDPESQPVAHETQIVYLFAQAMRADVAEAEKGG